MIPFVCSVVTAAALYYVFFYPGEVYAGEEKTRLGYLRERKEAVYENLRDLNFEFKAGKGPVMDYQSMRASLDELAASIMGAIALLKSAPREGGVSDFPDLPSYSSDVSHVF